MIGKGKDKKEHNLKTRRMGRQPVLKEVGYWSHWWQQWTSTYHRDASGAIDWELGTETAQLDDTNDVVTTSKEVGWSNY